MDPLTAKARQPPLKVRDGSGKLVVRPVFDQARDAVA